MRDEISSSDFDYLLKCLPLPKAPGPDRIPNELLWCLPSEVSERLRAVVNRALVSGHFPPSWKESH
eukprot:2963946-Rhodomonas_salina.1